LKTPGEILDRISHEKPDEIVINTIMLDGTDDAVTRITLRQRADQMALALREQGVAPGVFVPIHLPTCTDFLVATIAIFKAGGTPMPVSDKLPQNELDHLLALAEARVIVSRQQHTLTTLDPADFPGDIAADPALGVIVSNPIKALASGGSTGKPKLIITTGDALFEADNPIIPMLMRFEPTDLKYSPGPLYHNGPFWFSVNMLLRGGRVLLNQRFNADQCLAHIETYRPTVLNLVPTMMQRMLREPAWETADLSSVRVVWHLAAPCPAWAKEAFIEKLGGERVLELWAATEGNGLTVIDGNDWLTRRGSVGKPIGTDILILDEQRNVLSPGEVGEIFTRIAGAPPPCEYRGTQNLEIILDGYTSVGDLGWVDDDGYLYLADRRTDLIIAGGANIFPAEVEAIVSLHPKVKDVAVVGLKDEDLGRRVHAIVESFDAADPPTVEELTALCGEHLLRYKVPRSFEIIDALPRNEAGKIRRSQLRDERGG